MPDNETGDITEDAFYHGKVIIFQQRKGYRFSVDAPVLTDFLPDEPGQRALEIGTGSGVISLLALYRRKFSFIFGIEVQERLCELAALNAGKNGFGDRFKAIAADFNEVYREKEFSGIRHIFSNPPFLKQGVGRLSSSKEIRDAKFETRLNLEQLLLKSREILGRNGNLYLIFSFARYKELEKLAGDAGYFIRKTRLIFSFKDGKPDRFLVQLSTHKDYLVSPVNLEPLVIFKEKGKYTEEMEQIFSGR
jgi:tRNA1(Val) A37 N6-methylase TrmN6